MGIIEILEIKAHLTLLREAIISKNTIQVPKTKEDALKPIPKKSQDAINSLNKGIECISKLIDINNKLHLKLDELESQVTSVSFTNGKLKRDNDKLSRVNERLKKGL